MRKPLPRQLPTATRCALMRAAPSRAWHVFKPRFAEPWEGFTHAHPRSPTSYSDGLVAPRLGCGHPEQLGSSAYRGLPCGQGTPGVAMSGKASLCLRWANGSVDHWGRQVSQGLPEGVMYRPLIRTVPARFRPTCYHNAAVWLRALRRCGVQGLNDVSSAGRGKALQGGSSTVLHTHGRNGPAPPCLEAPPGVGRRRRGRAGHSCPMCPRRGGGASGRGPGCGRCVRRLRPPPCSGWLREASGHPQTVWCALCPRAQGRRSRQVGRATWPHTW